MITYFLMSTDKVMSLMGLGFSAISFFFVCTKWYIDMYN